jgi:hypothetical protein
MNIIDSSAFCICFHEKQKVLCKPRTYFKREDLSMKQINRKTYFLRAAGAVLVGTAIHMSAFASDANYKAAESQADANYESEKARCDQLAGNDKDVCIQQAKATKTRTLADAKVQHKSREARADAREDKVDADYKVAKEKCDVLKGDEKDACQERAKAQFGK